MIRLAALLALLLAAGPAVAQVVAPIDRQTTPGRTVLVEESVGRFPGCGPGEWVPAGDSLSFRCTLGCPPSPAGIMRLLTPAPRGDRHAGDFLMCVGDAPCCVGRAAPIGR